jgi:dihydrofolate synthase/folylpolyglutamate synthase
MEKFEGAPLSSPDDLLWKLTVPSRLGEKPTLDRMRYIMRELGDPQRGLPIVHIGGTSGKGSTATIAARILQEAGYRVGLHVKPHLERVEERFLVNGVPIETERLCALIRSAAPIAAKVRPTWYELTVALALQLFRESHVDVAVVEVGLGGTYDGTNVVESQVAVLTNVDLDHTEVLGDTVEQIATDKVGIIKPGTRAISGVTQETVRGIVENRCRDVGVPLWQVGKDMRYSVSRLGSEGSRFDFDLPTRRLSDLQLGLLGAHQVANAALAVAAVEALADRGFSVAEPSLRHALASVEVPGRLEVVRQHPLVVLDGAHNPAKMAALSEALHVLYPDRSVTAVLAFKRGHDLPSTLATLMPHVERAIITRFDADTDFGRGQSVEPDVIEQVCTSIEARAERIIEPDPVRAIARAIDVAGPRDLICVTGSLYLVGAVRPWLRARV